VIEFVLAHADLARMRFAHSPIRELMASLRVLHDPTRQHMYATWLSGVRGRLGELRLDLLLALAPVGPSTLDFVLPRPATTWEVLADELATVVATSPAVVRAELESVYQGQGRQLPAAVRPLYDDPDGQLPVVAEELDRYWRVAVAPVWQRLRAVCMADLAYRTEQFAGAGIARVLGDLHREMTYVDDRLLVDKSWCCQHRVDLTGAGMVLVPCVFTWPTLTVQCCRVDVPVLSYPPRGVAQPWGLVTTEPDEQDEPLCALLGRTRTVLLATLGLPATTTELAARLGLSPAAVSQHLKILKQTALVTSRRHGRAVLYQRTAAATALLTAVRTDPGRGCREPDVTEFRGARADHNGAHAAPARPG